MNDNYFNGHALNGVDSKGRLSIPASYREVVERRSAERKVIVAPHPRSDCLMGYDRQYSAKLQAQIESKFPDAELDERRDAAVRRVFGLAEPLPYEDTGRVVLPQLLRDYAEIDRHAFFLAAGDYFEIWNPELLLENTEDRAIAKFVRRQLDARAKK